MPSARATDRLRGILERPVAPGAVSRRDALASFFGQLPPTEAARMQWLLARPPEPLRRFLETRLSRRSVPGVLKALEKASLNSRPQTAPENLEDSQLRDEYDSVAKRLSAPSPQQETSVNRAVDEARAEELFNELRERRLASTEASEELLQEEDRRRALSDATQTGDYSRIDVEHATRGMRGGVGVFGGPFKSLGFYRWLERTPGGELTEVTGRDAEQLREFREGDLRWIFQGVRTIYLSEKVMVLRTTIDLRAKTGEMKPHVLEVWWKFANVDEMKAISSWAPMAETGATYQCGQLLRPLLGDEIFRRDMEADVLTALPGLGAAMFEGDLARRPGGRSGGPREGPKLDVGTGPWKGQGELPDFQHRKAGGPGPKLDVETGPWKGQGELPDFQHRKAGGRKEGPSKLETLKPGERLPRRKETFGEPGRETAGTHQRKGFHYGELNEAEITHGVRVDYDREAGRPRKVSYQVTADVAERVAQTDRRFTQDVATEGAQSTNAAYRRSGMDKGHLVQREGVKGSAGAERAVDQMTLVVPMKPALNRGAGSPWRASEARTIKWAKQFGSVNVEVEPIYDARPPRLVDGTPIPKAIHRRVIAPDGQVLEDRSFLNQ
jgi:hypothetical protein